MLQAEGGRNFINDIDVLGHSRKMARKDQSNRSANFDPRWVLDTKADFAKHLQNDFRASWLHQSLLQRGEAGRSQIPSEDLFEQSAMCRAGDPTRKPDIAPVCAQRVKAI